MDMTTQYIGIDVSKNQLDVARLCENVSQHRTFGNSKNGWRELLNWLGPDKANYHVCLEATGRYSQGIAKQLFQDDYPVSLVNPTRIHAYGMSRLKRLKTDKADALLIAQFCQTQQPELWTAPEPELEALQMMVRYREELQQMLQQERNRLESLPAHSPMATFIRQHIDFMQTQLEQVHKEIHQHLSQTHSLTADYQLLQSIPGIGQLTAAVLLAEVGHFGRFDKVGQLVAYAGLSPQERRSGSSVRGRTKISKRGNARLRKALYFPAMVAIRHNPILKSFAERLTNNGLAAKSVIIAVMRKLLHLAFGILRSRIPFDPNFQLRHHVLLDI
jgi:transposase